MKHRKLASVLLTGATVLTACADGGTSLTAPGGAEFAAGTATATKPAYVLSSGTALDPSIRDLAAQRGDEILYINEKAGFAWIRTSAPSVYGAHADLVIEDMSAEWIIKDSPYREAFTESTLSTKGSKKATTSSVPNPRAVLQWGNDAVNAPEAWAVGSRGAGARVAVLDDGIDSDHPDLAPNLNVRLSRSFVPGETFEYAASDAFSHGSHVSGTIAAADNAVGTIGVAPAAELVMVKVLSSFTGSGSFGGIFSAIVYASTAEAAGGAGADVINMSLGAYFPQRIAGGFISIMNRITNYAHQQGATIIASAGNDGVDGNHDADYVHLPSDATHVLSISATGPLGWGVDQGTFLDHLAFYSNHGLSAIDFAAPGGNVDFSLRPGGTANRSNWPLCTVGGITRECWVFDLVFSTGSAGVYYWSAGTSMASPHAAGIAALIIGENGGSMHPADVAKQIAARSDDLGKPGNDEAYGAGRVSSGY